MCSCYQETKKLIDFGSEDLGSRSENWTVYCYDNYIQSNSSVNPVFWLETEAHSGNIPTLL